MIQDDGIHEHSVPILRAPEIMAGPERSETKRTDVTPDVQKQVRVETLERTSVYTPAEKHTSPPYMQVTIEDVQVRCGEMAKFHAIIEGDPLPVVSWFKGISMVTDSERTHQFNQGTSYSLVLYNTGLEDGGVYTCIAKNSAGEVLCKAELVVQEDKKSQEAKKLSMRRKLHSFYEVKQEIGRGSFGFIKRVVHKDSRVPGAAKFIPLRSKTRAQAYQERDLLASLSHDRIVRLLDEFETRKTLILILELCSNEELLERLFRKNVVMEAQVKIYIKQLLEGIAYLHDNKVLHLDIKPSNILMVYDDQDDIKICDFGFAQKINPAEPQYSLYGSPEFVSPEILSKSPVSTASDIWPVGVISYLSMTCKSPFAGENDRETLLNIQNGRISWDSPEFVHLSKEAKDFITKMLQPSPLARPTAMECLSHPWFLHNLPLDEAHFIDTKQLKFFVSRSKWQRSLMSYKSVLVMRPIPDILEKTHQNTSLGIPRHLLEESSSSSTSGSSSDNEISTSPGRRHFGHPPELHLSVLEDSNYPEYEPFVGETKHPAPLRPTRYKEALARGHLGDPQGSGEQMSLKRQKRGTEGSSQDKAGLLPPEGAESGRSPGCIPRHSVIKSTFYSQPSESFVNVPSSPGKEHRKHLEQAKRTYRKAGYSKSALSGLREPLLEQFGEDEEGISNDEGTERFREAGIGPLMIKSASFDTAQKSPRLTFQVSNRSRSLDDYRMKTASFAEEQYIEEEEGDLIPQSPLSEVAGEESSKKMSAKESAKTLVEISMAPSMALPQAGDKQRSVWAAQQQEKMLSSVQPEEKEEGLPQKPSLSAQKGRPVPGGEGLILTTQPSAVSPKMSAEKPEIKEGQLPQTKPTSTQRKEGLAAFQSGRRTDVKPDLSQGTCKSGAQLPEIPSAGSKMEEIVRAKGKSTATLQIVPTEEGHGWLPQMPFVETKMASDVPFSGQTFALSATEDKGYQMVPQKPSPSTILTSVSLKGKSPVTSPVKPALISVSESESQQLLYQAPAIPRLLKLPDGKGGGSVSTETVPGGMSGTQIQEPSDSSGLVSSVLQSAKSVIQTAFPVDASHISTSQDRSQRDLSSKTQMYMSIPSEVERPPQQAAGIKTWTHEGKYHEHVEQESFVPGVGKPLVFEEAREPLSFISKPSLVGTATSQSQKVGLEESLIWSELPSAIPKSSRPQVLMPSHVRTIPTSHLGTERQEVHYPMAFDPSEVKLVTRKRPGQFVPDFPQAKYEPVSTPGGERPVILKRTLVPMDERRRKEQIHPKTSVYSDTESEALGNLVEEMVSLSQEMTDLAEVLSDQEGSMRHISPPREMFYQGSQGQTGRPTVRYLVRKGKREGGIGLADPSEEGIIYPGEEDIFIGKKARMSDFGRRFYYSGSQGSDPMDNRMYEIMLVQIQDLSEDMPRPDSKTAKFDISEVEPAFLNLYELYDIVYSPFEFLSFRKAPENLPIKRRFPMSEKAKLAPGLKAHWHQEKKLCVREDIIGGELILKEEVAAPSPPLERLSIQASRIGKRSDSEGDLPVGSQQMYGAPEDATGKRRSSLQSRLGLFKPFVRSQSMDLAEQSLKKKMKESVAHFSRRLTRKTSSDEESRADSEEQKSELQERTSLTGSIKKKIGFPSFSLSSLKIKDKAPSFVEALTDQTIAVGQSLTLSCRTSAHSSPHIEWFKDGATIHSTDRILISSTLKHYQLLTILAATRDDFGTYTCVATNSQGTVSTTCVIRRAEAPSNPSAPDIVEILEDGVQLAWKPVEMNTPVTYTVLCKKDDGEWKTLASDISDCCFTVEHLPQGLVYSFRIACVSKAGVGPYSNPTAKVKIGEQDQAAFQSQDKEEDKMMAAEAQPTCQTYAFQTEIKRGRFSIIKQCREKLTGNPLAAKIIPYRQEDTETVLQEYHILRRLHHSNIGQLQGAYVSPRHLVLIMELCVGPELLNTLAGRSSYSEVEVRDYLWQILSAVEYLHAQNILHLDLRSENMIITEPNLLKIVDFGNAQFYTPDRIITIEGCTDYVETMASELMSGKGAVPQTDIWAIGVTAFIMLSAEYPISSEGACDFGRRVKREKIKFNKCYAGLSGRAVSFLQSTLSSNPWRRPTAFECLQSPWLQETGLDERQQAPVTFSTTKLRNFWAERERKRALLCSKYGVMAV